MKPKLGQTVYCIYNEACILVDKVGFIGKDSFIIKDFINYDRCEWFYEDYNDLWFTNLSKATERLQEKAILNKEQK